MQPAIPSNKAELLTKRSSEGRKDPAAALADAIRKVSSSASGLDEALKAEKSQDVGQEAVEPEGSSARAASFTQPIKRQQGHHRQVFASSSQMQKENRRDTISVRAEFTIRDYHSQPRESFTSVR